jgi:hypothetical protein
MKGNFTDYLTRHNYIEKFNTGFSEHLRLSTELSVYFEEDIIALLKSNYETGREIGGIISIAPEFREGKRFFYVKEITFITNRSDTPHRSYRPDEEELSKARQKALKRKMLPFNFHSHPTEGDNILSESFNYYSMLDTSDADKIYRYLGIEIGQNKLRLPDVLIVANGKMKSGLFIGIYGGLIAPLDFTEKKDEVMSNFLQNNFERIQNYFDTPQKKTMAAIGGIAAAIGAIALFAKYPKAIFPTLLTTATLVPAIAYSASDENRFFGISQVSSLKIILPKLNDEKVIENEKTILRLYEERKQGDKRQ